MSSVGVWRDKPILREHEQVIPELVTEERSREEGRRMYQVEEAL